MIIDDNETNIKLLELFKTTRKRQVKSFLQPTLIVKEKLLPGI